MSQGQHEYFKNWRLLVKSGQILQGGLIKYKDRTGKLEFVRKQLCIREMDASGGGSGGEPMVGTEVHARYRNGSWYPAIVSALIADKYVVDWQDGDTKDKVFPPPPPLPARLSLSLSRARAISLFTCLPVSRSLALFSLLSLLFSISFLPLLYLTLCPLPAGPTPDLPLFLARARALSLSLPPARFRPQHTPPYVLYTYWPMHFYSSLGASHMHTRAYARTQVKLRCDVRVANRLGVGSTESEVTEEDRQRSDDDSQAAAAGGEGGSRGDGEVHVGADARQANLPVRERQVNFPAIHAQGKGKGKEKAAEGDEEEEEEEEEEVLKSRSMSKRSQQRGQKRRRQDDGEEDERYESAHIHTARVCEGYRCVCERESECMCVCVHVCVCVCVCVCVRARARVRVRRYGQLSEGASCRGWHGREQGEQEARQEVLECLVREKGTAQ